MSQAPIIECKPDGPYLVKNLANLRNSKGERLPTKPVTALCRCGGSANKPFCDGTHTKNGFSSARLADGGDDKLASYKGKTIAIHDNRSICAHVGHCTDGLDKVFDGKRQPWIDPDGAAAQAIIAVIKKCPSGALSYTIAGGAPAEAGPPSISAIADGPFAVTGGALMPGQAFAQGAPADHFTLCRCGASRNKPFCDGSHWDAGFKAD
jgi:CDGSH-type Zn-finger protein